MCAARHRFFGQQQEPDRGQEKQEKHEEGDTQRLRGVAACVMDLLPQDLFVELVHLMRVPWDDDGQE